MGGGHISLCRCLFHLRVVLQAARYSIVFVLNRVYTHAVMKSDIVIVPYKDQFKANVQ